MGKVTLNGMTIDVPPGASVSVVNGIVLINGTKAADYPPDAMVRVEVTGHVGELRATGDVAVSGNVTGAIKADGSVTVQGGVGHGVTASGFVKCGEVTGNVSAVGSVQCGRVGGSVTAGGSVQHK